jgi:SAM-dependent methyltransferase
VFDRPEALPINETRMSHLASLQLPLDGKKVIDVGCGVGHLAQFFLERNCTITCVDARPGNIALLKIRCPGLEALVADVEKESLSLFGRFDVVFCYGSLYHLEAILQVWGNIASVCDDMLLLETVVCDSEKPLTILEEEPPKNPNQSISSLANRPSPSFVTMGLASAGFSHVYTPQNSAWPPWFSIWAQK